MKKSDIELILKSILKVTFIMIVISTILKLFGLNIFNLDLENKIINYICDFLLKFKLTNLVAFLFMYLDVFIYLKLSCNNKNSKVYYLAALDAVILNFFAQILLFSRIGYAYYSVFSLIVAIILAMIVDRKFKIIKPIVIALIIICYQSISLFLRNVTFNDQYELMYDFLLNFDYMILMIITYYLYLLKGSDFKCTYSANYLEQQASDGVSLYSVLKTKLLKLQKKYQLFLNSKKSDQAFVIIYLLLSAIYELFNLLIIIFVAFLNHTVIECLFILTSFLITKKVFGKPFHFNSASKCFIIILNRITFSIGISFVIPVFLGIILSYVTSLLVKSTREINLYRGMKENTLREICNNHNLNSVETDILVDFYTHKMSLVKLSLKYNYSKDAIWKKKKAAIKKLKG